MLTYIALSSLDGFMWDLSDPDGQPTAPPTAAFFSAILELQRPFGTFLYGRRMYETMAVWQDAHTEPEAPPFTPGLLDLEREFAAQWRAVEKVVYSTTLASPATPNTRIERTIDVDALRSLNATVGGPTLAAQMLAAGLVGEIHVFVHPVITGRGIPWLPKLQLGLELVAERRLGQIVHLHYTVPRKAS